MNIPKEMYGKGYRYKLVFENSNIPPLFIKSSGDVGPLMRIFYPNEKNYQAITLNPDGSLGTS